MPPANTRRLLFIVSGLAAGLLIAVGIALYAFKSGQPPGNSSARAPRPAPNTPRGVMWDVWQAAFNGDVAGVRAGFHATTDDQQRAADALAELLVAEAAFARQLQHTWPVSPTSRDGAGTWFAEGDDAALLLARETIDAAAINATVNVQGTPVKLVRAGGAWKIATADLARTKLKRGPAADPADVAGAAGAAADLSAAAEQLAARAKAYRDLRAEVAALRLASPSAAVEKLGQSMPSGTITQPR